MNLADFDIIKDAILACLREVAAEDPNTFVPPALLLMRVRRVAGKKLGLDPTRGRVTDGAILSAMLVLATEKKVEEQHGNSSNTVTGWRMTRRAQHEAEAGREKP